MFLLGSCFSASSSYLSYISVISSEPTLAYLSLPSGWVSLCFVGRPLTTLSQYLFWWSSLSEALNIYCASSSLNHVFLVHLIKPFLSKHGLCALVSHIVYLKLVFYQEVLCISKSSFMLLISLSSNHIMLVSSFSYSFLSNHSYPTTQLPLFPS